MMFDRDYFEHNRFFRGRYFDYFSPWHIIIVIGLIILTISIVVLVYKRMHQKDSNENLRKLLKERYINGEITEEEYKAKKKIIDEDQ